MMNVNKLKIVLLFLVCVVHSVLCMDHLHVIYEWKQVDFAYPTESARQEAIAAKDFIQENNLPLGLEVYGNRLFITVPRWKTGVAASLTYIYLNDTDKSPKLNPYPDWEAHRQAKSPNSDPAQIISPFRIRADQCGRLWVLDSGMSDILGDIQIVKPPTLLIYDLHNDILLRKYEIPRPQLKDETFLANIAVEDEICDDTFAYLADLGEAGLIVYSWKTHKSWRIKHNYFNIDPTAGEFNVSGISFQWSDALFGIALSPPGIDGFSTLYFHPLTSTNEFSVSTKYLRDPDIEPSSVYSQFKHLGDRGPNAQSSVSFLDKNTGVLFYALINLNAIACWRTSNPNYTMQSQGRVYMSNVTMVFPNDIKVDPMGNLWVLSDRLPKFMYEKLDPNDVNFRVLSAPVADAIKGTACDSKLVIPPKPKTNDMNVKNTPGGAISINTNLYLKSIFITVFLYVLSAI